MIGVFLASCLFLFSIRGALIMLAVVIMIIVEVKPKLEQSEFAYHFDFSEWQCDLSSVVS